MTRIKHIGISKHMAYIIKELTVRLNVGEKTILRWVSEGLQVVPGGKKPFLILGDDLIEFLKKKDAKKKAKLKRSQFYCFSCKGPRLAKRGSIKILSDRKTGDCCVCSGKMSKIITSRRNPLSNTATPDVNVRIEEPEPPPTP